MNENEYQYRDYAKMPGMSSAASSLTFSTLPSDLSSGQRRGLAVFVVALHVALGWAWWNSKTEAVNIGASEIIEVSLVTDTQSMTKQSAEQREPDPEPVRQPVRPQPVERVQPKVTPVQAPSPTPPVLTSQSGAESVAATPVAAPAVVPATAQAAPAVEAAPVAPPPPTTPREVAISSVSYLIPPVRSYPRASREMGEQGNVMLRVLVDEQGRPVEILVAKSSGYPRLDQHAVMAMRAARFRPYMEGGVARRMWAPAPFNFTLEDN